MTQFQEEKLAYLASKGWSFDLDRNLLYPPIKIMRGWSVEEAHALDVLFYGYDWDIDRCAERVRDHFRADWRC